MPRFANEMKLGVTVYVRQENPSFVPKLEIYNAKDKPVSIDRDDQPVLVNPSTSCELKSGDKINIVAGISIE